MSNFAFLQAEWPAVHEDAARAEAAVYTDPRAACFHARRALELLVNWAYKFDASLRLPYRDTLSALLHEPTFKAAVGQAVLAKALMIKDAGNDAVHSRRPVQESDALCGGPRSLPRRLLARSHLRSPARAGADARLRRERGALGAAASKRTLEQLQKAGGGAAEARREALRGAGGRGALLDSELARVRAQVASAKRANTAWPDTHDYAEAETRDRFIERLLKGAGWPLDQPRDRDYDVGGMPNQRARATRTTCSGATTASRSPWSRPSARANPPGRPAAGQRLCGLPRASLWPAPDHLLHQRLRALDLGRPALPAARRRRLLQEDGADADDGASP